MSVMKWFRAEGDLHKLIAEMREHAEQLVDDSEQSMVEAEHSRAMAGYIRGLASRLEDIIDPPIEYNEPIPDYGDVFTIAEFTGMCTVGALNDYDGCGAAAKDGKVCESITVYPSMLDEIPKDATHVVWFNK